MIISGVNPSIHATYKHSGVKQYFKEGRALRTETTINDTYDIGVGRSLEHLPDLIAFGRATNHRLLASEEASAAYLAGIETLARVVAPTQSQGQRASALALGDPRAFALEAALCAFAVGPLRPQGFRAADPRAAMPTSAPALAYTPSQSTYDLRRLRLKGFIDRIPHSHRYRITEWGLRTAFVLVKVQGRILPKASSKSWRASHAKSDACCLEGAACRPPHGPDAHRSEPSPPMCPRYT